MDNLATVESRIHAACDRVGRPRSSVRLLPVTKTLPAEIVRLAIDIGMTTLGENKVQEAVGKSQSLMGLGVRWCVIGHLQTNKVKQLVSFASEFQALDSLRLASLLNERLIEAGRTLDVFVQVNTSGEASKYGILPDEVAALVAELPHFPALRPRGLMTLAILKGRPDEVRGCFRRLREVRDRLQRSYPGCGIELLSMGMTSDFEIAIEEGADIVRVGQAIFGKRPTKDGYFWPGLPLNTRRTD
ncbi:MULTISPECIES: YggS family pyridoxal phosphate-dependent enzyme [Rhizobium/Agrobacterium group]|nr:MULTISPECIES: YggS family pyridoxal phosphate-dependent enzyme [Rhizobium/Agrobacterium group]